MSQFQKIKGITIAKLLDLAREGDILHLRIITGEHTLRKLITTCDINRPGLALAGDYEIFDYEKIQVFGRGESLPEGNPPCFFKAFRAIQVTYSNY